MIGRDIVSCPLLINDRNFNFPVETPVPVFMSRPQQYVATSNGAFHLKTTCNFVFFVETSFTTLLVIHVATLE